MTNNDESKTKTVAVVQCGIFDIPTITFCLSITLAILVLNEKYNKNVAIASLVFSIFSLVIRFFKCCWCKQTVVDENDEENNVVENV